MSTHDFLDGGQPESKTSVRSSLTLVLLRESVKDLWLGRDADAGVLHTCVKLLP